jgi:hypothetical protein
MPGEPDSPGPWGEGPLVVDNSAWSRAHRPGVREDWNQALLADRFCISPIARLEILFSARDGEGFDELAEHLSTLRTAPLTNTVIRAAAFDGIDNEDITEILQKTTILDGAYTIDPARVYAWSAIV